jgi:serine/threonine-protein kinase HipA
MKHFDYSQANSFSYEQLFHTLRELRLPYPAAEQLFRRMVFNVMARNCDDHTENFPFRLKKDGIWELTPAYDVCHAYQPQHQWVSQHDLSIHGKRTRISKEDLLTAARSIHHKNAAGTIEEIRNTVDKSRTFADEVEVSLGL